LKDQHENELHHDKITSSDKNNIQSNKTRKKSKEKEKDIEQKQLNKENRGIVAEVQDRAIHIVAQRSL